MVELVKEHKWIFINGLVMAFLVFMPNILFPYLAGESYRGINIGNYGADEFQYIAAGREVLDGNSLGNIALKEGKDWFNIQQTYVAYWLMWPVKLFRIDRVLDPANTYHVYGFFGVWALAILIYFFVLRLSEGDRLLAILTALFVIGGYQLVVAYPIRQSPFGTDFNYYSRPTMPLFSAIGLFIYLNFLLKTIREPHWKHVFWSGAAFGLLFYLYFYLWTFALALNGILVFLFLLKKDFLSAKSIVLATLFGLLVGAYVLVQLFLISGSATGERIIFYHANLATRDFVFSKIAFLSSLLFAVFSYKNKQDKNLILLAGIILAAWAVLNQQLITGRDLEPMHYFWYFVIPMSIVACLYMIWFMLRYRWQKIGLFCALFFVIYGNTLWHQSRAASASLEYKTYMQRYRPIIDYLNKELEPGVILASDIQLQYLFVIYTPHDLYWSEGAMSFNTPNKRLQDAFFVYSYLNKKSRNDLIGYYNELASAPEDYYGKPSEDSFLEYYYEANFNRLANGVLHGIDYGVGDPRSFKNSAEILAVLNKQYDEILKDSRGIANILQEGGVNYMVLDKNRNPEWDVSAIYGLHELVSNEGVTLYKL